MSRLEAAEEECQLVTAICRLLGVGISEKTKLGDVVGILGITFDFGSGCLGIKEERRVKLLAEIEEILTTGILSPGRARKLKGKLLFVASHFSQTRSCVFNPYRGQAVHNHSGSVHHASHHQSAASFGKNLDIFSGKPKPSSPISRMHQHRSFFSLVGVIQTFDHGCQQDATIPGLDGLLAFFQQECGVDEYVRYGSFVVTRQLMAQWEERDTLINVVELVAVVASPSHLAPVLRGKPAIIPVDTESVEGTLILGSSHMEDIADLVTLFWELVLVNDVGVHVARMPTDSNPSGGPSRNESEDLEAHGAAGEDRHEPFHSGSHVLGRRTPVQDESSTQQAISGWRFSLSWCERDQDWPRSWNFEEKRMNFEEERMTKWFAWVCDPRGGRVGGPGRTEFLDPLASRQVRYMACGTAHGRLAVPRLPQTHVGRRHHVHTRDPLSRVYMEEAM